VTVQRCAVETGAVAPVDGNREENTMAVASAIDARETATLIGSDKVEGTAVYGADQNKIGKLERVMLDKISGKVAYAVLSFGGFMGMGNDYYPVPWSILRFDTSLGGYKVNFTKDQLEKAPKYARGSDWSWSRENGRRVSDYYRANPDWNIT
jgi:PRC-barrel domain